MSDLPPLPDLLAEWAQAAGTCFVDRDGGPVTYGSVRRNDLEQLIRAAVAAERAENVRLRDALKRIAAIENKLCGGDWDEIEEARGIAAAAIRAEPANVSMTSIAAKYDTETRAAAIRREPT